ncbi:hypothetical protein D3C73_1292540 [compost metagenome]
MAADITKPQSSQNRIANRMQQHIRVGMAQQPFFIWNRDSADNARSSLYQLMYVKPLSYSYHVLTLSLASFCILRKIQVLRSCKLNIAVASLHHRDRNAAALRQAGIIRTYKAVPLCRLIGSQQLRQTKSLRGLNRPQTSPVRRGDHLAIPVHLFDRIFYGYSKH